MSGYLLGILTPFVVLLGATGLMFLTRFTLRVVQFTLVRCGNPASERRAALAAVTYSCKRMVMLAAGDVSVAIFVGQDVDSRVEAYDRLKPRRKVVSVRDFTKAVDDD